MSSNVTLRSEKGSPLTSAETDDNFIDIRKLFRATEDAPVATGTANAIVLTNTAEPVASYTNNMVQGFRASNINTGSVTVNIDGVGITSITAPNGSALEAGDIVTGVFYTLVYNLSQTRFELLSKPVASISPSDNIQLNDNVSLILGTDSDANLSFDPTLGVVLEFPSLASAQSLVRVGDTASAGIGIVNDSLTNTIGLTALFASGICQLTSTGMQELRVVTTNDEEDILLSPGQQQIIHARTNLSSQRELGFFGVVPVARPDVTGATGGNAALQSLLTQLESLGLITDSTT